MVTKKLKIQYIEDIDLVQTKSNMYSYAFRYLYNSFELSTDKKHIDCVKSRFNMTDIEYRSLVSMAKAKLTSSETNKENISKRIEDLEYELINNKGLTKKEKYNLFRKIQRLKHSITSDCVFGGKKLLQKITREYNKGETKNAEKLNEWLNEYKFKRNNMPFVVVGEANYKANRFYDLCDIANGNITYKPKKGVKCEIRFKLPKNHQDDFTKLSELIKNKEIAVTIYLNTEYIYFTYDEEILNGYAINIKERRKEVDEIKKQNHIKEYEKELIKDVYRKYYDEQSNRKLANKLANRCCAIDLNPTNIGYSIIDLNENDTINIIHCGCFDLSKLCVKLGKRPDSVEQKKQNNKRRYELTIILKELFKLISHYKCSTFIMEDLSLQSRVDKKLNKESNRKIKNIWNRELIENIIQRRCHENGISLEKINPCYSSFIGNIQYDYIDPINASIEVGRRGLLKYKSGTFYPNITENDIHTMISKFGIDVEYNSSCDWVMMYKFLIQSFERLEFAQRLRTTLNEIDKYRYSMFSLSSYKSKINYIKFN